MITKNKILQKSLLVFLILVLPASMYTFSSVTAQSLSQAFAANGNTQGGTEGPDDNNTQGGTQGGGSGNTQGGTQGFVSGNTTSATLNPNYTSAAPIIK